MTYIDGRATALLSAEAKNRTVTSEPARQQKYSNSTWKPNFTKNAETVKTCNFCKQSKPVHTMQNCGAFEKLSVADRIAWVNKNRLCNNCFSNSHMKQACMSKYTCRTCRKKHYTLLHLEQSNNRTIANVSTCSDNTECIETFQTFAHIITKSVDVLLATAVVVSTNKNNDKIFLRALLDQGSQSNFVTESACQAWA